MQERVGSMLCDRTTWSGKDPQMQQGTLLYFSTPVNGHNRA
jgi:hypothetical protein